MVFEEEDNDKLDKKLDKKLDEKIDKNQDEKRDKKLSESALVISSFLIAKKVQEIAHDFAPPDPVWTLQLCGDPANHVATMPTPW